MGEWGKPVPPRWTHVRILVVEDDPVQAKAVAEALGQQGWSVEEVESVDEAREALSEASFDVAVVDHELPDGTGLEVLETGQREAPGIPVVYLTGTGDEEVALKALSQGAAMYLTKGGNAAAELPETIRDVAEGYEGVAPVEVVEQEESEDPDRPPAKGRRTRHGPAMEGPVDADGELADVLAALVDGPVLGIGVYGEDGQVRAADLPEGVAAEAAGVLASAVAHQFEALSGVFDLGIESQYLLGRGEEGVLGLTVVPGPLVVVVFLVDEVAREQATRILFRLAAQVWEAAE